MESMVPTRPWTFRVENIPPGTTAEELIKYFYAEDQPRIRVRSIVPAVDSYELDIREYTATLTFQALNQSVLSPRLVDEDISIDCDFHGFTPLNHPQEPIAADIIAVTGLAAHAFGSWAHSAQNMWLRDYLPRDVSNARVLIYGYPSQLHGNISRSILSDHSTNMIHRLLTMREMAKCQDRPIVFIGHSLGCLIIKKALIDINGSVGIYSSRLPVRSIVFMGAPHKGLETTALETLVKSQATEDMIRELKSESPTLTELNDKFRHVAKNIDILTCYELSPTKTAIEMPDGTWKREGPPIMMVSLDSARQWYPREEFVACNADHSQIAKLKRGENSIYPSVRWAIKKGFTQCRRSLQRGQGDSLRRIPQSRKPDPGPTPLGSPSEDAIDQQIRRLPQAKVDQSAYRGDTQFKSNAFNETVSQWRSGIEASEWDDARSSANPTKSAETDMASVLFDEDGAASKSTELTVSLGAEFSASKETKEETNPDSPKKEVDENTALQTEVSNTSTNATKSMIMDKVIESAIIGGDKAKTRELLALFYDVNCKDNDGITPLLLAARYRHENIIRMLLEQGANPSARCNKGHTTLHWLTSVSEIPITETLIDLLLSNRPPLEVASGQGATPLMNACANGELLLATRLIRHGADVRATTSRGLTALHYAAYNGEAQMIPLLVANGAELEAETSEGDTPLHEAARSPSDSSDTVEQLLRAGADKEAIASVSRWTPLHRAIWNHNKACVTCLLDSGANIEAPDKYGWRPLHAAAVGGQVEIVKTLLDHGANPTIKTTKLVGSKPSGMRMNSSISSTQKQAVRALLKEAEKTWKQSGKK